jgi:hypothetical protein
LKSNSVNEGTGLPGFVIPVALRVRGADSTKKRPNWQCRWLSTSALVIPLLIGGCSNVLIHDERRAKQGQDAKRLVAEARTSDTVASLAKSFAEVAALEEARARDRELYLFESELRLVASAPSLTSTFNSETSRVSSGLQTVIEARLKSIGLIDSSIEKLAALRTAVPSFEARQRAIEATFAEFRGTVGHRFENCNSVYLASSDPVAKSETLSDSFISKLEKGKQLIAKLKFPQLIEDCGKIDKALQERKKHFSEGSVAKLIGKIDQIDQDVLRYEFDMRGARQEITKATKALSDSGADAAATPAATGRLETLEARASRLADLVRQLSESSSLFGAGGAHAVAAERLASLEALLGSIAGSNADEKVKLSHDETVAVAIVRDMAALADDANKLLTQAQRPRLVPFVAAIDQQKLVLAGFESSRLAKRKQQSAIRSELEAVLSEASALVSVLAPLKMNGDWAQRSISDLLGELKGEKKISFLRALAVYADEAKLHRVEAAAWSVRAQAAQYEETLSRSKNAAAQWDALLDMMATVLADYHAAGIKTTDLAEFFKALGLVTLGVGVAK